MIKLNLKIDEEKMEFNIPENWDEVTIDSFIKLFSFEREGLSDIQLNIKTLQSFVDIDEEFILMMNLTDFTMLVEALSFANSDVVTTECEFIELEGEKYYLKTDFDSLSMGEVISIETLIKNSNGNLFKVMDQLLCIFLRKKKDNGNLEAFRVDMMDRAKLFRNAPISKVYNIFNFFLPGENSLENNTVDSTVKKRKKTSKKVNLKA